VPISGEAMQFGLMVLYSHPLTTSGGVKIGIQLSLFQKLWQLVITNLSLLDKKIVVTEIKTLLIKEVMTKPGMLSVKWH